MPNQKPTPNQKPITNPELVEALKALHQENTPQNQGKVLGLVVERAVFLTPAVVTPAPQQPGQADSARKQATIQFQLITTKDGRPFFPAFTDAEELRKFAGQKPVQSVVLRFDDYVSLIQRNEKACGFVVNPLGLSLTLDRKTVESLAAKKKEVAQLRQQRQQQAAYSQETIEKDAQVMVGDPDEVPQAMLDAVAQMAQGREDIRTLWLRQMIRPDGTPSLIIVVDHTGAQARPSPLRPAPRGHDPLRHQLCRGRHRGSGTLLPAGGVNFSLSEGSPLLFEPSPGGRLTGGPV